MPEQKTKRGPGRPKGWTKWGEPSITIGHSLPRCAHDWIKAHRAELVAMAKAWEFNKNR